MTTFPAQHVFPDTSSIDERGHLVVGGCSVVDLASEYGTPLYVIDETTVRNRCRAFRNELNQRYPDSLVLYGSKAFSNIALTGIIVEEGLGIDVVSGGEAAVAKAGGASPENRLLPRQQQEPRRTGRSDGLGHRPRRRRQLPRNRPAGRRIEGGGARAGGPDTGLAIG